MIQKIDVMMWQLGTCKDRKSASTASSRPMDCIGLGQRLCRILSHLQSDSR